jgi:boron transporter
MPSLRSPFSGISDDFKKRGHLYLKDFEDFFNLKVLASVLFMFFTSIGPAVTFASLLQIKTKDDIGAVEVMLSTAITGVLWSFFAGQPLVILGVTGPVSILTISIYGISESWGLNFLPFYAWAQIWASLMHIVLAILNFCDLITLITRFSVEIFGVLIAVIYIYTGIVGITEGFGTRADFEAGVFQLLISLGTAWLGLQLAGARSWVVFNEKARDLVADYGPTVALVLWSAVPYMGSHAMDVDIKKLDVPHSFGSSSGRNWLIDLTDIPVWGVFAAILPGFIITVLFFFDHNVSSLMAQAPEFKLKKPSTFHWDFLVMGCCIFVTG